MSLNKVTLIGFLGADPEIRTFPDGGKVCSLRVATTEKWRDKNTGESREKTEWHQVSLFGGLVDVAEKYLKKGSQAYFEGQLKTRKWQDKSGNDRYSTGVVLQGFGAKLDLLDRRDNSGGGGQAGGNQGGGGGQGGAGGYGEGHNGIGSKHDGGGQDGGNEQGGGQGGGGGVLDDEIPF